MNLSLIEKLGGIALLIRQLLAQELVLDYFLHIESVIGEDFVIVVVSKHEKPILGENPEVFKKIETVVREQFDIRCGVCYSDHYRILI